MAFSLALVLGCLIVPWIVFFSLISGSVPYYLVLLILVWKGYDYFREQILSLLSGCCNSGNHNLRGYCNKGSHNRDGCCNTGTRNHSGCCNSGNHNVNGCFNDSHNRDGCCNTGTHNHSGCCNFGNHNVNGCFNEGQHISGGCCQTQNNHTHAEHIETGETIETCDSQVWEQEQFEIDQSQSALLKPCSLRPTTPPPPPYAS